MGPHYGLVSWPRGCVNTRLHSGQGAFGRPALIGPPSFRPPLLSLQLGHVKNRSDRLTDNCTAAVHTHIPRIDRQRLPAGEPLVMVKYWQIKE